MRAGPGDLLADDIFYLPDGARILDCLEFDDRLRAGDVLAGVALLAMDVEALGESKGGGVVPGPPGAAAHTVPPGA